jgi:hypothetical protein
MPLAKHGAKRTAQYRRSREAGQAPGLRRERVAGADTECRMGRTGL